MEISFVHEKYSTWSFCGDVSQAPVAEWVCHLAGIRGVMSSTLGTSPAGGMVAIDKRCIVWGCLWLWQLKDPLGSITKSRALHPCPGCISWPDIMITVCERAIKPNSINQSNVHICLIRFSRDNNDPIGLIYNIKQEPSLYIFKI